MRPLDESKSAYAIRLGDRELFRFPGFIDVHTHLREPGFSYKETIYNATRAAAAAGYTGLCAMPNLNPVPDSLINLKKETDIIERDALIPVYPYASITRGERGEELSDMESLAPYVIAFSDDGVGVQSEAVMREAMTRAKALNKPVVAHCEAGHPTRTGFIHEGVYARANGIPGISPKSEWLEVERDIRLADETGAALHICHVSTLESVGLIRDAKKSHVNVSAETCPHYLLLDDSMLRDEGSFKMNPPIRGVSDRKALLDGVIDSTIDMLVTDHAPHSKDEKSLGLRGSAFGVSGIDIAFKVLYTGLVKEDIISLDHLIELIALNPRKRFGIAPGSDDRTVWDLCAESTVDPDNFISLGRSTPFKGMKVYGKCLKTVCNGNTVYEANDAYD